MPFGVIAIAFSLVFANIIDALLSLIINKKMLLYSFKQQIRDFIPSNIIALLMFLIVSIFGLIPLPSWIVFVLQILIGISSYIFMTLLFNRNDFIYFLNIVKRIFVKKPSRNSLT